MTEKRFEAKSIPNNKLADRLIGVFDEGVLLNNFAVVRILNELAEENRQLKLENTRLSHDLFWANKKIEEGFK